MRHRSALLLAVVALLALATVAYAATKKVTPSGVGGVKLGKTHKALRSAGLVGPLRKGCPLAGPQSRSAALRRPLKGSVDYTQSAPRRVVAIAISGGAEARGVGIGDSRAAVKAAYPKVKFDTRTRQTFGIILAKVPENGGGRLQFAIDAKTNKVLLIGVPRIRFCE
jgi:hypothetical protein